MAGNLSNYAELAILEHSVGKTSWTKPSCYVALYTVAPTDSSSGTEVSSSGTAYTRQQLLNTDWASASSGSITTASDVTFPTATASWGTVVAAAIVDASSSGNIIWYGTLTSNKTVDSGDTFKITAGNLTLSLD
jgi:hypothetical protein